MKKVSYGAIKGAMRRERVEIRKYIQDAEARYDEAVQARDEIHDYLKRQENPTKEDRALLRDATKLVKETEERLIYMRGVLAGASAMETVILKYLIVQNLDPFGFSRR